MVHALENLADLGALALDEGSCTADDLRAVDAAGSALSPLGRHLAQLPVEASAGRMLVFASVLG